MEECRRYASHAANLHEVHYKRTGRDSNSIRQTVKKNTDGGRYYYGSWSRGCSDEAIQAVKEVFLDGKRYLPRYVTEFDTFPNDIRGAKKRSQYSIGDTVRNIYDSTYQFYMFFNCEDIAGYFQEDFEKYSNDVALLNGGIVDKDVTVNLNGVRMNSGAGFPFINYEGRTMVPVRAFAETIDCKVEWYEGEKEIRLLKWYEHSNKKYLVNISLYIGKNYVISEGGTSSGRKYIDTRPIIKNDRTYIPLRIAAEMFDYIVEWDEKTKSVKCYYK